MKSKALGFGLMPVVLATSLAFTGCKSGKVDAEAKWKKLDEKAKQPYAIAMKNDSLFAFAGLWETWRDKAGEQELQTYTIVTTDANELMEQIHNEMQVIVEPKDYERWMAPTDPAHLPVDLLKPYPAEQMKAWKVSRAVGNTRNNDPSLIARM